MSGAIEELSAILIAIRKKIFYILFVFFAATMFLFQFSDSLISWMKRDLLPEGAKIVYIAPLEVMMLKIKIALILATLVTLPLVLFIIIKAISKKHNMQKIVRISRIWLFILIISAVFMFLLGASYAYFIMLPLFIKYLYLNAVTSGAVATYSIFKFISFAASATIVFGIIFELPILLVFLTKNGIIQYKTLVEYRRHIYVLFLIAGALITPPDVISQVMVALPFVIFFEISLIIVRIIGRPNAA